jgi:alpha-L-fucosidase 2
MIAKSNYPKYRTLFLAVFLLLLILPFSGIAQQTPLRLWYKLPATYWEACLPLGNGRLGVMPDGGIYKEKMVLNDITLWSGGVQDADLPGAYQYLPQIRNLLFEGKNIEAQELMSKYFKCKGQGSGNGQGANVPYGSYQILSNLTIDYQYDDEDKNNADSANYVRSLSLDSAIATTSFRLNNTVYRREYFASFYHDCIIIRLSANENHKINFKLAMNRPERFSIAVVKNQLQMSGQLNNSTDGNGMKYLTRVSVNQQGGELTTINDSLQVKNASSAIIYISSATDYKKADFVTFTDKVLNEAIRSPYSQEKSNHIKKFRTLFTRASLNLGKNNKDDLPTDERLAAFTTDGSDGGLPVLYFQYGRYLLISSTRRGLLPPNLQGLWANEIQTPWNGDYHLDINIQMNHWPLEVTNLGMLNEPFFDLVKSLVNPGEQTAKAYYDSKGWVAHVITNIWGYTSPGEEYSWGAYNTGSAWLCQMLYAHFEFTRDTAYLKKLYPIIKGSAQFYLNMLVKEPLHGWLVTAPSNSPENAFILPDGKQANVCAGPTIDNQLIRYLFNATIQSGKILKTDVDFGQQLEATVKQLPPNQVSNNGLLMEWLEDYPEAEPHHRHVSPLWALYPGNEINDNEPKLVDAAKALLEARGDEGTGWSLAWKINLWARLHDGNRAFKILHRLLKPLQDNKLNMMNGGGTFVSLLCGHPPFQIDGNFGGTAGIAEMLLQSSNGYTELLPALPDEWKDGSFKGWRARGGAELDAVWENSRITSLQVKATVSNRFKIKVPVNVNRIKITLNNKTIAANPVKQMLSLNMKKGQIARLIFY